MEYWASFSILAVNLSWIESFSLCVDRIAIGNKNSVIFIIFFATTLFSVIMTSYFIIRSLKRYREKGGFVDDPTSPYWGWEKDSDPEIPTTEKGNFVFNVLWLFLSIFMLYALITEGCEKIV